MSTREQLKQLVQEYRSTIDRINAIDAPDNVKQIVRTQVEQKYAPQITALSQKVQSEQNAPAPAPAKPQMSQESIEKERRIQEAYTTFERAARTRDDDPEGYEQAKFQYYSLKNGPDWAAQEKKRISDKKMDPVLTAYRKQYQDLEKEHSLRRDFTNSIATIRDKQASMKSSLQKTFSFFNGILDEKKDKMSVYDRYLELTNPDYRKLPIGSNESPDPAVAYFSKYPSSFKIVLDVFIALLILAIVILAALKGRSMYAFYQSTPRPYALR
jgi:hypothetical protein